MVTNRFGSGSASNSARPFEMGMTRSSSPWRTRIGQPARLAYSAVGNRYDENNDRTMSGGDARTSDRASGKTGFENQPIGATFGCRVGRHRRPQRSSPKYNGDARRDVVPEPRENRVDVSVQSALGGSPGAAAVAAVIDGGDSEILSTNTGEDWQPHGEIAAVAMEVDDERARCRSREHPHPQSFAIRRLNCGSGVRHADFSGRRTLT